MTKGDQTRERIVDHALRVATRDGLDGLSIGGLAQELGLSKSGLFAHFHSKEQLQLEVLQEASRRFQDRVLKPAFQAPRGLPRLKSVFERWLTWISAKDMPGGCLFIAAAAELDDQPGPPRDLLVSSQKALREALSRSVRLAIEEGHLSNQVDPEQVAFEVYGVILGYQHAARLLGDAKARERALGAFHRLISSLPTP